MWRLVIVKLTIRYLQQIQHLNFLLLTNLGVMRRNPAPPVIRLPSARLPRRSLPLPAIQGVLGNQVLWSSMQKRRNIRQPVVQTLLVELWWCMPPFRRLLHVLYLPSVLRQYLYPTVQSTDALAPATAHVGLAAHVSASVWSPAPNEETPGWWFDFRTYIMICVYLIFFWVPGAAVLVFKGWHFISIWKNFICRIILTILWFYLIEQYSFCLIVEYRAVFPAGYHHYMTEIGLLHILFIAMVGESSIEDRDLSSCGITSLITDYL